MRNAMVRIMMSAAIALLLTSVVTVRAHAEESEGYSEESSGFEAESNDSSSDSSSSEESHDDPAPEPASEPTASEDPAPAPAPATEDSGSSSSSDSSSDSGSSTEQPSIAPFYAEPIVVAPVVAPAAPVAEAEVVAPKKTTQKAAEVSRTVVTPYEPPYDTNKIVVYVEDTEEPEDEAPTPVIDAGVLGEKEGAQMAPQPRKFNWALLIGILAALLVAGILGLLFFFFFLYKPYKVERVKEDGSRADESSFRTVKQAAEYAVSLLDSKDFEANFAGFEISKKNDDKDEKAKKADRIIVRGDNLGSAGIIKATSKERRAVIDVWEAKRGENPFELTAEEAVQQWAEMATA